LLPREKNSERERGRERERERERERKREKVSTTSITKHGIVLLLEATWRKARGITTCRTRVWRNNFQHY